MANLASSNDIKVTEVGEQLMGLKQGDNLHIWYDLSMPEKYVSYIVKRASEIDSIKKMPLKLMVIKWNGSQCTSGSWNANYDRTKKNSFSVINQKATSSTVNNMVYLAKQNKIPLLKYKKVGIFIQYFLT